MQSFNKDAEKNIQPWALAEIFVLTHDPDVSLDGFRFNTCFVACFSLILHLEFCTKVKI